MYVLWLHAMSMYCYSSNHSLVINRTLVHSEQIDHASKSIENVKMKDRKVFTEHDVHVKT